MKSQDKNKKVILLVGSPRKERSASEALGLYLCKQLDSHQFFYQKMYLREQVYKKDKKREWIQNILHSDLIILVAPLYVDSLPSFVIKAFEMLHKQVEKKKIGKDIKILAIMNSGFPESSQSQIALDICGHFARQTGMVWLGGLALGSGMFLGGKDIGKMGWFVKNIKKSLNETAVALNQGMPIPESAISLMQKKLFGKGFFRWVANYGFKFRAKRNGLKKEVYRRPYEIKNKNLGP